jgi:hypothetical protein
MSKRKIRYVSVLTSPILFPAFTPRALSSHCSKPIALLSAQAPLRQPTSLPSIPLGDVNLTMDEANPATGLNASTTPGAAAAARKSQITSCAECRRLKLRCVVFVLCLRAAVVILIRRCDRVFPCSSCIRRGCANLCPNGTLEKGKRGFLKRLEQSLPSAYPKPGGETESEVAMFVARDSAMTKRIQELEAALAGYGISLRVPGFVCLFLDCRAGIPIPGPNHVNGGESSAQENEGRAKRPRTSSPPTPSSSLQLEKDSSSTAAPDATDVTLGFGTLTIDGENRSRYIGPSGGAAYLSSELWKMNPSQTISRRNSQDRNTSSFDNSGVGSLAMVSVPVMLGHSPSSHSAQQDSHMGERSPRFDLIISSLEVGDGSPRVSQLEAEIVAKMSCLPPHGEAIRIARLYFRNASFMQAFYLFFSSFLHITSPRYEIISEEIFFNLHLPAIYPDGTSPYVPSNLHQLSVCAMVLALGAFFDLSLPISDVRSRATEFYELALASLNISIPLKIDTIPAVQTLHLMALYSLSTRGESGGDSAWQMLGMAMRSIQAQGCHRDGSRWGLPQRELEERRRLFWETHIYDRLVRYVGFYNPGINLAP